MKMLSRHKTFIKDMRNVLIVPTLLALERDLTAPAVNGRDVCKDRLPRWSVGVIKGLRWSALTD